MWHHGYLTIQVMIDIAAAITASRRVHMRWQIFGCKHHETTCGDDSSDVRHGCFSFFVWVATVFIVSIIHGRKNCKARVCSNFLAEVMLRLVCSPRTCIRSCQSLNRRQPISRRLLVFVSSIRQHSGWAECQTNRVALKSRSSSTRMQSRTHTQM